MNAARPFQVVNCISRGFAVAGPSEHASEGVDLELIYWDLPLQEAKTKVAELNEESGGHRPPLHRHD